MTDLEIALLIFIIGMLLNFVATYFVFIKTLQELADKIKEYD